MRWSRVAAVLALLLLITGCTSLRAPSPKEFAESIAAAVPMARDIEVRSEPIEASNCPLSAGAGRAGYVATYQIEGLPDVSILVQADHSADVRDCATSPGAFGLTSVDLLHAARECHDSADVTQVAGVIPLADVRVDAGQTVGGHAAADCYVVGETVESLLPGGDSSDAHLVYLEPDTLDVTYLGPLSDVIGD